MVLSFHSRKRFFVLFRFFFIELSQNSNYVNFSKYLSYRCLEKVHIRSFLDYTLDRPRDKLMFEENLDGFLY